GRDVDAAMLAQVLAVHINIRSLEDPFEINENTLLRGFLGKVKARPVPGLALPDEAARRVPGVRHSHGGPGPVVKVLGLGAGGVGASGELPCSGEQGLGATGARWRIGGVAGQG